MSNALNVRRVKVQTLDEKGNPEGEPTYGVMAADSYNSRYNDTFYSFEELNREIKNSTSILAIIDNYEADFPNANEKKIGYNNYYGKDWQKD